MATDFEIIGPIEMPHQKTRLIKLISKDHAKEFWQLPDTQEIAEKQGCYVFALQAAKGYRPWYVGKATKTMKQEATADNKLQKYNEVLHAGGKGTPVMFFVVLGGTKKKAPANIIDEMETFFIQAVLNKHPEIKNIQKTNLPEWTVKGVVRSDRGQPAANAKKFRTMMGL